MSSISNTLDVCCVLYLIRQYDVGTEDSLNRYILTISINNIIYKLTEVKVNTMVPPVAGIILVIISMLLTIIAGLIPAKMASKKDPVEALRTE